MVSATRADAVQQTLEAIKFALRMPWHGSYVDWAREVRDAYDSLRAEVVRLREERDAMEEERDTAWAERDIAQANEEISQAEVDRLRERVAWWVDIAATADIAKAESARAGETAALERVAELERLLNHPAGGFGVTGGGAVRAVTDTINGWPITAAVRSEIDPPRETPK